MLTTNETLALDLFLEQKRRDLRLPGLAAAVVQGDQVIYLRGLGKAGPGRLVTKQTPFIIGSLSKSFTALAIMQLVEAGKLELDAPVQHTLPWFRVADPTASAQITLRHLLTHTSGLSRYTGRDQFASPVGKPLEQRVRELADVHLTAPVGTLFHYSNTNYTILGLVLQVVSGQSYQEYMQQHLFMPLQMRHSDACKQDALRNGAAVGSRWWFGMPFSAEVPFPEDAVPAGYLYCCAEDLAQWLIVHINEGFYRDTCVLSPEGMAQLHRPHVCSRDGGFYALGWHVDLLEDGETMLRHGGEVASFRSEMMLLPHMQLGVVVLTNCNNGLIAEMGLDRIVPGVLDVLMGRAPRRPHLSFKRVYVLMDLLLLLLSGVQVWSLVRLLRQGRPLVQDSCAHRVQHLLPLTWEVALPLVLVKCIPRWADAPWHMLRVYVPDLSLWLLVMQGLTLTTGLLRLLLLFVRHER